MIVLTIKLFFSSISKRHHCESERRLIAKVKSDDEKITVKEKINYKEFK
jgi:hypothetical protein